MPKELKQKKEAKKKPALTPKEKKILKNAIEAELKARAANRLAHEKRTRRRL